MPNEEIIQQPEEQVAESNQEAQAPQEPQDLSEAFKVLRANEQAATASSVEPEQPGPEPEQQEAEVFGTEQNDAYADLQQSARADLGGSAIEYESADYNARAVQLDKGFKDQAIQLATQALEQADVHLFETKELYRRDEQTGEVTFFNPEKPNQPFESRAQAQAWCDSINKDIKQEFGNLARNYYNQLRQEAEPALRTLAFAPTYDKMTSLEKSYFEDIIAGSEVYNVDNEVIGYNVDLNAAYRMAQQFAQKYGNVQQDQQAASVQQNAGPAVDMRSSSSSAQGKQDVKEPTNLEEAMRMLKQKG